MLLIILNCYFLNQNINQFFLIINITLFPFENIQIKNFTFISMMILIIQDNFKYILIYNIF
jgi:hypothetical protein